MIRRRLARLRRRQPPIAKPRVRAAIAVEIVRDVMRFLHRPRVVGPPLVRAHHVGAHPRLAQHVVVDALHEVVEPVLHQAHVVEPAVAQIALAHDGVLGRSAVCEQCSVGAMIILRVVPGALVRGRPSPACANIVDVRSDRDVVPRVDVQGRGAVVVLVAPELRVLPLGIVRQAIDEVVEVTRAARRACS